MKTSEQHAVFAIFITVLVSYIYYLILDKINSAKMKRNYSMIVLLYLIRKCTGFILLGIMPAFLAWMYFDIRIQHLRLFFGYSGYLGMWLVIVTILLIFLNSFSSKSPDLRAVYPEMRIRQWNIGSIAIAGGGWILYLTGYEYLFRGILLFNCIAAFGIWPAISINLALYTTLHLVKGLKEAMAAIPFGAFLCYITIESNSVLPAILIHSVQAISAEIFCIYRNKEMSFSFF
jgi:membrane protease YdiL (CAAX protease family)